MRRASFVSRATTDPDCRTCGACCGPTYDETVYVGLWDVDIERLSPLFRRRHVDERHDGGASLRTKRTEKNGVVCIALRGTIGRRVSCSIYDRRPNACREFKPGSADCRDAREEVGIS